MKQLLFITAFLLSASKLFAQLNESDTAKFQLRVGVTGNYQQGNVEVVSVRSKLEFSFAPQRDIVFKSQNSSLYQSFYSQKADDDIFSRNYIYYKPQNKVYPFAIGYMSANFRRKIDSRYFAGVGSTWQVVNTKNNLLKLSASGIYEVTKFAANTFNYAEYNGENRIEIWRGTLYLAGWNYILDRHIRLYYDAYWQPAFSNRYNYRTNLDMGIEFLVWKGISFNALFTYTHENLVVTSIFKDDKILTFGLAYNFKRL